MSAVLKGNIVAGEVSYSRNRIFVVLIAFWHTLRRDLLVTWREFIPFLLQVLGLPLSLLFVFGKVLPQVGATGLAYPTSFLPGLVAFAIFLGSILTISLSLMLDLGDYREIDDRLLAPLPVSLVAVEKVVFSSIRALIAGALLFPLAYWILGSGYQVRTDMLLPLAGIMVLYALSSSALGLLLGAALPLEQIYILFTIVLDVTLYTGCVYYTWNSISSIKALQIVALFNPMTYAAEGLRFAMVPTIHGQSVTTIPVGWIILGLSISFVLFLSLGIRAFLKRVIY